MKKLLLILLCLPMIGFGQTNLELGERIYFKNYPNAHKVDISFKEPKGWQKGNESFATDNNNLVLSFLNVSKFSMIQIYISKTPFDKQSKTEIEEMLNNKKFVNSFVSSKYSGESGYSVDNVSLTYINGYPFLKVLAESYETQYTVNWMTFIDNKMINIVCASRKSDFEEMYPFFKRLKGTILIEDLDDNINKNIEKINGLTLRPPDGFIKTADFIWEKGNDAILINPIKHKYPSDRFEDFCKDVEKREFILFTSTIFNGKEYQLCFQKDNNDKIYGMTLVKKDGFSYIITAVTKRDVDADNRIGRLLGYMISNFN